MSAIAVQRSTSVNESPEERSSRTSGSALRCLELLELIAASPRPVGVSELARTAGLPRGSVHLHLATMVRAGWVERLDAGRYRLTLTPVRVGRAALEQADLGSRVLPTMEALAQETGEAVSLSVLDGGWALIVQRVESGHVLRLDLRVGTRMPLDTSASGRVLAAHATDAQLVAAVAAGSALPDAPTMHAVRASGVAVSADEYLVGIAAVAAPVRDSHGQVIAALSAAGPTGRVDPRTLSAAVRTGAHTMSRILGGEG